jgi:hypothetical protein
MASGSGGISDKEPERTSVPRPPRRRRNRKRVRVAHEQQPRPKAIDGGVGHILAVEVDRRQAREACEAPDLALEIRWEQGGSRREERAGGRAYYLVVRRLSIPS